MVDHDIGMVRTWAKMHGIAVSSRGVVAKSVIKAYAAAHSIDHVGIGLPERKFQGADRTLSGSVDSLVETLANMSLLRVDHEAMVASARGIALSLDEDPSKAALWKEFRAVEIELRALFSQVEEVDEEAEPPSLTDSVSPLIDG